MDFNNPPINFGETRSTSINKQLYNYWAPSTAPIWAKYTKPAMFIQAHTRSFRSVKPAVIPSYIQSLNTGDTAIVVDLPGATGIEVGLGLADAGFRPVPLYNGIHETNNGGLRNIVDNKPIIDALLEGADMVMAKMLSANAPPAFLLDSNRYPEIATSSTMYDNRWTVDLDDMPDRSYMRNMGIKKVFLWTDKEINKDIKRVLASYRTAGIEIAVYSGKVSNTDTMNVRTVSQPEYLYDKSIHTGKSTFIPDDIKESVRRYENGRFGLLLVVIMACVNFFGMFFVLIQPFLWTSPSIMWLTYLWLPESIGDIIAILMTLLYIVFFIASGIHRGLIIPATVIFIIDTVIFYIYAFWYGFTNFSAYGMGIDIEQGTPIFYILSGFNALATFAGYSFIYGLIVFGAPVLMLFLMIRGAKAYRNIAEVNDFYYSMSIDNVGHDLHNDIDITWYRPRRRFFRFYSRRGYRGYRGFTGYGSYGKGGYSGKGYGGYYGGYSG